MPLSDNNIESELSYAYLHAIASRAGLDCRVDGRHADNDGVDALIDFRDEIPGTWVTNVNLRIQLKATTTRSSETATHLPYAFRGIPRYDKLRIDDGGSTRLLAVLFLPHPAADWLNCSADELILKTAAFWVCLYGAKASTNDTSQTVYLPKVNLLTPDNLRDLCIEIGKKNIPSYVEPRGQ
jgi:hypothetical protein